MSLKKVVLSMLVVFTCLDSSAGDRSWDYLIEQGHYKQARVLLEDALRSNPDDAIAMMQLAYVELEFNDVQHATPLAEKAAHLKPNDAQAHAILADCYGQATDNAGMFDALRLSRAMRKELDAALAIDPKNYEALHTYMQFYLEAPGFAGGSKSKALEMAERISAVDPYRGARARIEIALHENQREHLLELYQKAVDADPKAYDGLIALASLYTSQNLRDLPKASEYAQHAIKIDPARGFGYAIVAQVMVLNEQWGDLDQLLLEAEHSAADDFIYYYRAGRALLTTGKDNARAEKYFRKYLSQSPEAGRPSAAHAHWQLGLVLEKQGRKQDAVREVEAALNLDPHLKAAKEDLKRMKS